MNRLDFLSGCTCPGYGIAYTCTVCGAETTTTVWEGTAFQCPETSNEIALRHSQFTDQDSPESGDCSGGSLIAYATGKEQNCYISQLNATVSADLNGSTIECSFEARGMNGFQTVNRSTVSITTGIKITLYIASYSKYGCNQYGVYSKASVMDDIAK